MKIMICEGNIEKAKLLTDLLNVYKFRLIILTENGEFFKKVQSYKPAIIIINKKFIGKPGENIINQIRSNPVCSKTPIIYISDSTDLINRKEEFSKDSLTELIQEPYKIKNLRHYVDRWTTFRSLYIKH